VHPGAIGEASCLPAAPARNLAPPAPPAPPRPSRPRPQQVPDADKRRRADFVIDTGCSLAETEAAVAALVEQLAVRGGGGGGGGGGAYSRALQAGEGQGASE
jgi:hypothetical protein